jgi:hypothetical protein
MVSNRSPRRWWNPSTLHRVWSRSECRCRSQLLPASGRNRDASRGFDTQICRAGLGREPASSPKRQENRVRSTDDRQEASEMIEWTVKRSPLQGRTE